MAATDYKLQSEKGYFRGMRDLFVLHDKSVLFILTVVYAAQGLRSLGASAVFFYFKDELGIKDEALAQFWIASSYMPWYMKPVYGLMADNFPIFGSHRKAYLLLSALFGVLSYLTFAWKLDLTWTMIALICGQLSQVVADVVADALMVTESRKDREYGSSFLQTYSWTVLSAVSVAGGFLGSYLSSVGVNPSTIILNLAIAPAFIGIATLLYSEQLYQTNQNLCSNLRQLLTAFTQKATYQPVLFLFLIMGMCPKYDLIMKYYFTNELEFSSEFIFLISGLGGICYITGAAFYSHSLKFWPYRKVLSCGQFLLILCCLFDLCLILHFNLSLGISNEVFYVAAVFITSSIAVGFLNMPIIVLAAELCPVHMEATMYASIASVINLGSYCADLLGSGVTATVSSGPGDYSRFWILILIQMGMMLIPFPFLYLLPHGTKKQTESEEKAS